MIRYFIHWIVVVASIAACGIHAQSVRILTAHADGLDASSSEARLMRLTQIADALRPVDADLIVVSGITERAQAEKLAVSLKPTVYQLAVFAAFTNSSSTAIFSKRQPFGARSAEWRAAGQIELPGGFGFAGFRSGTNAFCFYVANLPGGGLSSLSAAADPQASRKRELAAQYLAHHVQWLNSTLSNYFTSFCVIGDLVMEPKSGRMENAGRIMQQAGFSAWLAPVTSEPGADLPFTAVLARGATLGSAPAVVPQTILKQPVCVYEIYPGRKPGPFAAGALAEKKSASRSPNAVVFWIWAGIIVGVCGLTIGIWWLVRKTSPSPAVFHPAGDSQMTLEVDEVIPASSTAVEGESARADADLWQARAIKTERRVDEDAAHVRAGLLQRLQALVGDRFVAWLAAQRGKLIASHDIGTQQVLELEGRLKRIQSHFEEQIQNRDQRITDLEREIQAKETLIRKLLLARANPSNQSSAE